MLTLTFLGVGSAIAKRNFHSNVLIEAWSKGPDKQPAPDELLLIDFGGMGPLALHQLKLCEGFRYLDKDGVINYSQIRRVIVTHVHGDHVGGLEEMAIQNKFCSRPRLGPPPRPELLSAPAILQTLWDHYLRGPLEAGHGRRATLADYFVPREVVPDRDRVAIFGRYRISLFPTDHLRLERAYDWASCGVLLEDAGGDRLVVFSGDTRFRPTDFLSRWARATQIFHEVQLHDERDPVHTLLSELRTLPPEVKRKIVLYHFGDDWDSPNYAFVAQEFAGFARPRERYLLFE